MSSRLTYRQLESVRVVQSTKKPIKEREVDLYRAEDACSDSYNVLDCNDEYYEMHNHYLRRARFGGNISLANEKRIFHSSIPRGWSSADCHTVDGVLSFFYKNKQHLFSKCNDRQEYSHCQEHYIMKVDKRKGICKSYRATSFIHDTSYSGVTLVHHLRLSDKDSYLKHLKRWSGPISSVFYIEQSELKPAVSLIMEQNRTDIIASLYILPKNHSTPYRIIKGQERQYSSDLYPINELRDIGIESILTTHYFLLDINVVPTENTYQSILENKNLLKNYKNVLLLPLLKKTNQIQLFFKEKYAYRMAVTSRMGFLPATKEQLLNNRSMYDFSFLIDPFNVVPVESVERQVETARKWVETKDHNAIPADLNGLIEPNGVFRRSALNILFHPYFTEERVDRLYLWRLKRESSADDMDSGIVLSFFILPQSFGMESSGLQESRANLYEVSDELTLYSILITLSSVC